MNAAKFFRHSIKLSRYHIPTEFVVVAVLEFFALLLSLYLALEIRFWDGSWHVALGEFLPRALVYAVVMQLSSARLWGLSKTNRPLYQYAAVAYC